MSIRTLLLVEAEHAWVLLNEQGQVEARFSSLEAAFRELAINDAPEIDLNVVMRGVADVEDAVQRFFGMTVAEILSQPPIGSSALARPVV